MLTVGLVVAAAAYSMLKPYIDQMLGREAASIEEEGAGM
jgi:hypothetical protein